MPRSRSPDQTVEAFSASKALLKQAKARAAVLRMTKSGYFRYCLALELGYPDDQARELAAHNSVQALRTAVEQSPPTNYRGQSHPFVMNDQAQPKPDETIIHDKRKKKSNSVLTDAEAATLMKHVAGIGSEPADNAKFAPRPATGGQGSRKSGRPSPSDPASKVPPPAPGAKEKK